MPPALGLLLLVLPLVRALHRSNNDVIVIASNDSLSTSHRRDGVTGFNGFTVTEVLPEGELRRVTRWNGICAEETIVDWGDTIVALREVTLRHSRRKLRLIYEDDTLTDCIDVISTNNENDRCPFDAKTKNSQIDDGKLRIFGNEEITNFTRNSELKWLGTIRELRKRCIDTKMRTRNLLMIRRSHRDVFAKICKAGWGVIRRIERSLQQMVIAPGTKWCGPHRTANSYKELGPLDNVDRCCRRHDHCHRSIPPFSELYNLWNYMPFTLSHCGCDQRKPKLSDEIVTRRTRPMTNAKRSRIRNKRELLLIPGTQWCGRGNRATKYTNLGGFGKADACCRRHDTACPFYIPAFETRYGLFNWGISTVMHCTCDERFRTCLKMAGTSSANFIGRIFFNVVQTKCFVLKPQKVCVRQSWWGKCEKHRYKKQAHLRDNVPY